MKEITVSELKHLIDTGADFVLIDVREPYEHDNANIGGELIPFGEIMARHDEIVHDKPVILYCRSGSRSAASIQELEKRHGFTNLSNLKGGILAWAREIDPSIHVI